jgi:hypothetical protein
MYYTGINPLDGKEVYSATDYREKLMQRALLQYKKPENRNLVREALVLAGREDLIGFGADCLVKPDMRVGSEYYENSMKNQPKSRKNEPKGTRTQNARKQDQKPVKNAKNSKNSPQNGGKLAKNSPNKNKTKNSGNTTKNRHSPKQNSKKGRR